MDALDDLFVSGLEDSGRVLTEVGEIGDKILNNPIIKLASAIPVVILVVAELSLADTGVKAGGALLTDLGGLLDRKTYEGENRKQKAVTVVKRSIKTGKDVAKCGASLKEVKLHTI